MADLFRRVGGERVVLHLTNTVPVVDCDPGELVDVLLAVVMDSSAGEITITTQRYEGSEGVFGCITLHQTGSESNLALSLAGDFARKQGGWARVDSEVAKGVTASLYLPTRLTAKRSG